MRTGATVNAQSGLKCATVNAWITLLIHRKQGISQALAAGGARPLMRTISYRPSWQCAERLA
jgi:hypothetical protein